MKELTIFMRQLPLNLG